MDITKGFQDISLNKYFDVRIVEYSRLSNFSEWEIKGIIFFNSATLITAKEEPLLELELFIKKIPTIKGYTLGKLVGDDGETKIDFTAHGTDAELLEKFLKGEIKK